MTYRSSPVYQSYLKTTAASVAIAVVILIGTIGGAHLLPHALTRSAAILGSVLTFVAAIFAAAGFVVLARYRRRALAEPDLYLELNRSREPDQVGARPARPSRARRWLGQRMLGHELLTGDVVEVRPWHEIQATLDERGCLGQLPFMPEMLPMCGQRAVVYRAVHRIFDYRKTRRMRHLDGAVLLAKSVCNGRHHGGCEAACLTIWKAAWLRRVTPLSSPPAAQNATPPDDAASLRFGTDGPNFACQLTQLNAASRPIGEWSPVNFVRPLVSGNVAPAAFVVGWLTNLFNDLQHWRQGVPYPEFEPAAAPSPKPDETTLTVGDTVIVRSPAEIRATVNAQSLNRGLYFEPDMLKHTGRRYKVDAEIRRIVDIVTGEMRQMKTPAYIVSDLRFSGERQLFNVQHEPLFWRAVWLQRVAD